MPKWMMVLSDGETYSELDGCFIVAVPNHLDGEDVDEYIKSADGWYCFDDKCFLPSNNGLTEADLDNLS